MGRRSLRGRTRTEKCDYLQRSECIGLVQAPDWASAPGGRASAAKLRSARMNHSIRVPGELQDPDPAEQVPDQFPRQPPETLAADPPAETGLWSRSLCKSDRPPEPRHWPSLSPAQSSDRPSAQGQKARQIARQKPPGWPHLRSVFRVTRHTSPSAMVIASPAWRWTPRQCRLS